MAGRSHRLIAELLLALVLEHAVSRSSGAGIMSAAKERQLARANCNGLSAEALLPADSLLGLLDSEEGRRAARDAAIHLLFINDTEAHKAFPAPGTGEVLGTPATPLLQTKSALQICGNPWLDWLPWVTCRVQSPPARPEFLDDDARIEVQNGGPLCRPSPGSRR